MKDKIVKNKEILYIDHYLKKQYIIFIMLNT